MSCYTSAPNNFSHFMVCVVLGSSLHFSGMFNHPEKYQLRWQSSTIGLRDHEPEQLFCSLNNCPLLPSANKIQHDTKRLRKFLRVANHDAHSQITHYIYQKDSIEGNKPGGLCYRFFSPFCVRFFSFSFRSVASCFCFSLT